MDERMPVPVQPSAVAAPLTEGAYFPEAPARRQGGANLIEVLFRKWKTALLTALIVCAAGVPAIWLGIQPQYTATSAIRIDPVSESIAFEQDTGSARYYSNYVNSQANLIEKGRPLYSVLEDPLVKDLEFMRKAKDPMLALTTSLKASADRNSSLLFVSATTGDPRASATIANAAVRAYMKIEGTSEASSEEEKLRTLERERASASEKLRGLYEAAYQLGEEFGTTDLTAREQVMLAQVQALQEKLTQVQTMLLMLQMQESKLKADESSGPGALELLQARNEYMRNDPAVASLNARSIDMELEYTLLALRYKEDSAELVSKKQALETTKLALEGARKRASDQFDELMVQVDAGQKDKQLRQVEEQLSQARAQEALIKQELDKQNSSVIELGRKGLAIKKIQDEIALTRDLYNTMSQRIQILQVERQRPPRVSVAYEAEPPGRPSKDKRAQFSIVLVLGAFVFGCAFVVFLNEIDPRVETPSETEDRCGLRVLGTTPRFKDLDRARVKPKHFVDDCRTIRVNLMLASGDKRVRSLVIASAQGRDGKTTLAINLATSIALAGKRVLLIDGDLRKPEIARYLRINNARGLTSVLAGECSLEDAIQATLLPTLSILPSNRRARHQSEMLAGSSLAEVLAKAQTLYDEVIIDTPAVLAMPDAKLWAALADAVMLVARSSKTGAKDLMEARSRILQAGARILGVVITGVRMGDSYEKYQHRYGEGFVDEPVSEDDWSAQRVFLLSRSFEEENGEQESK